MENKPNKKLVPLLPNYFKKVGIILMITTVVLLIVLKILSGNSLLAYKDVIKTTAANLCILGLFFVAIAKDKIEDERNHFIRLVSMAWSFISIIIYVIIVSSMSLAIKDDFPQKSIHYMAGFMLFTYLLTYYSRKESM